MKRIALVATLLCTMWSGPPRRLRPATTVAPWHGRQLVLL